VIWIEEEQSTSRGCSSCGHTNYKKSNADSRKMAVVNIAWSNERMSIKLCDHCIKQMMEVLNGFATED
jgi:transposase